MLHYTEAQYVARSLISDAAQTNCAPAPHRDVGDKRPYPRNNEIGRFRPNVTLAPALLMVFTGSRRLRAQGSVFPVWLNRPTSPTGSTSQIGNHAHEGLGRRLGGRVRQGGLSSKMLPRRIRNLIGSEPAPPSRYNSAIRQSHIIEDRPATDANASRNRQPLHFAHGWREALLLLSGTGGRYISDIRGRRGQSSLPTSNEPQERGSS
jgi:hypothetical protein